MEMHNAEEDLENNSTYRFLRDLSLPAEPLDAEENVPSKRISIQNQKWHPIDRCIAPPEYLDLESGEYLTAPQQEHFASTAKDITSTETRNDTQSARQSHVASAVWDVIDPKGAVRGFSSSVPEAPVFSTGMVPTEEGTSRNTNKCPYVTTLQNLRYSRCELFPPSSKIIPKPSVDRPLGCKSIVITGLPLKMKMDYVQEVFRACGRIHTIKPKKPFAFHIKFCSESAVDKALQLNGYRVVIRDRPESPYCGMICIEFVPDRREQQDYCMRKEKEAKNEKKDSSAVPSHTNFSETNATRLVDQLHDEETFKDGVQLLIRWMEEGKCNEWNSFRFFSMLQAMQSFVSRLMKDTAKVEEEVRQHQCRLNGKYATNSLYFMEMMKVFNVASSQMVWEHFSKAQRNRIELWKKHIEEIKESNSKDLISGRVDERMNMSEDENSSERPMVAQKTEELKSLQKENERLKKELRVAQREIREKRDSLSGKIKTSENLHVKNNTITNNHTAHSHQQSPSDGVRIVEEEARLIAAVGAFLNFYRFGESIDCICDYLLKIDSTIAVKDIEPLLRKFPTVFKEVSLDGDDNSKSKWIVLGF